MHDFQPAHPRIIPFPEPPHTLPDDHVGDIEPDPGYPFNALHHPDPRVRAAATAALQAALTAWETPQVRALPCPGCGAGARATRVRGVLWLGCDHCPWQLGLTQAQEAELRVALTARDPPVSPAALLAEWVLLTGRVMPVGYPR